MHSRPALNTVSNDLSAVSSSSNKLIMDEYAPSVGYTLKTRWFNLTRITVIGDPTYSW